MNRILTLFVPLLFSVGIVASAHAGLLRADGPYFTDPAGRKILLRGINLSNASKVPPFQALTNPAELNQLRDLGFNNIRLLFIWEAFEPQKGQYNLAYLDELGAIVQQAAQLGMYVVVDFHMDGFSRYTIGGCGSGAPAWTVPSGEKPGDANVCRLWNFFEAFEFADPWSSFREALKGFYDDRSPDGTRARYLAAWGEIARYFKTYPNVIGYDLLNEPWGNEERQIAPIYDDAAQVIRAEDPNAILFIEPSVLVALGWSGTSLPKPSFGNFAYAPHDYDALALGFGAWIDFGLFIDTNFGRIEKTARHWDAPVYVGEFGVAGSGGIALRSLLKHYYGLLDKNFAASAQWDYSPTYSPKTGDGWNHENMSILDQNGEVRRGFIARAYPSAVAGTPGKIQVSYSDVAEKRSMKFSWKNDPSEGATDFYLPPALYYDPTSVRWSSPNPDLECSVDAARSLLSCRSSLTGTKKITILGPQI